MTWAEFCIRSYGNRKKDHDVWFKVREVAYASLIGPHMNPKKLPKSREAFMPLRLESIKPATDSAKELLMKKIEEYNKKVSNGK